MKVFLLSLLFAIAESKVIHRCSNELTVKDVVQEKTILLDHVNSPYQLAIDYDTNTLFFSYTANKEETFESVYLNLKDKTSGTIKNVKGGFANAVDNKNQIVYIGGRDGIYQFNYDTKEAIYANITSENIWQLFNKDGLYFTTYPDEKAYFYKNGETKRIPELENIKTMLVAVDNNNNIFYSVDGALYTIKRGQDKSTNLGDYSLNAFNNDVHGNLYFSTPNAIYSLDVNSVIEKIASIPNIYGFAIQADDTIIYADESNIVELKPAGEKCINNTY